MTFLRRRQLLRLRRLRRLRNHLGLALWLWSLFRLPLRGVLRKCCPDILCICSFVQLFSSRGGEFLVIISGVCNRAGEKPADFGGVFSVNFTETFDKLLIFFYFLNLTGMSINNPLRE